MSKVTEKKSDVKIKEEKEQGKSEIFIETLKEILAEDQKKGPLIFRQIPKVMADIDAITKERKAAPEVGAYAFRGIDDVYNELHSIMAKHQVFTTSDILEEKKEERNTFGGKLMITRIIRIKYTFWAVDGSSVFSTVQGEGMSTQDKASSCAFAIAHKYALLQIFMIPTEEQKDPELNGAEFMAESEEKKKAQNEAVTNIKSSETETDEKTGSQKDINFKLMDGTKKWMNRFDILGCFADAKKVLGQAAYYKVLNKHGVAKADKIRKHEFQKIFDDLCFAITAGHGEGKLEDMMSPEDAAAKVQKLILELVDKHGADPLKIPEELKNRYGVSDFKTMDPDQAEQVISFLETSLKKYQKRDKIESINNMKKTGGKKLTEKK